MTVGALQSLAAHLALGLVGGLAADALALPMPYLLGSLCVVAPVVIWRSAQGAEPFWLPKGLRFFFVAVIGALIGARFSPDLIAKLPTIWISLLAVAIFVILAHIVGYIIYRRVAGYDRATALYGAMPGGLVEGVALGEQAGGNAMLLTVHHFARIVIVVVTVPLLFSLLAGQSLQGADGAGPAEGAQGLLDALLIALLSIAGLLGGQLLKIPAGHLMGPLVLVAVVHGLGLVSLTSPEWLLALAQLVVGTGLAKQFAGATPRILARAFSFTLLAVGAMFGLTALAALAVSQATIMAYDAAFVSFAPGGLAEMGLIALALDASPVLVAMHHLVRIVLTVIFVRIAHRWLLG